MGGYINEVEFEWIWLFGLKENGLISVCGGRGGAHYQGGLKRGSTVLFPL